MLIAIPAITGIGILSSTGLYASVIAPHKLRIMQEAVELELMLQSVQQ